ncbi:MAG: transcriptional repressor [candidate division Zixibacteria bacterium]|nr:transcriptional repressor [candidate division Zixibacteria bacterium]NIR66710.1 transcriptional repressor [candidate division Zixibacteria bacterium]NIS14899.1 transcriptional repressor [candidate division Zixibacteria bacterium]NIS48249.1 transcriptional repressor [candidate division Zixibacteria bacterium]NIT51418.1 transcriptional repressor [candidate division Zixibacteria bacterium]
MAEDKLQSFFDRCRENGLKITPQRTAIYEFLSGSNEHPTAEQIYAEIRKIYPNISFDTVNRTLKTFAETGLIDMVEGYGSPRRYDPNLVNHHHIHCVKCREIFDFQSDDLDDLEIPLEIIKEYRILNKRVVLNAVCSRCRRKNQIKKRRQKKRSKNE